MKFTVPVSLIKQLGLVYRHEGKDVLMKGTSQSIHMEKNKDLKDKLKE